MATSILSGCVLLSQMIILHSICHDLPFWKKEKRERKCHIKVRGFKKQAQNKRVLSQKKREEACLFSFQTVSVQLINVKERKLDLTTVGTTALSWRETRQTLYFGTKACGSE